MHGKKKITRLIFFSTNTVTCRTRLEGVGYCLRGFVQILSKSSNYLIFVEIYMNDLNSINSNGYNEFVSDRKTEI